MLKSAYAAALVIGLVASFPAYATETTKPPLRFDDLVRQQISSGTSYGGPECSRLPNESRTACEQWQRATFDHQRWIIEYRQKAYEAHHDYTRWVFFLVCALVALGMWLSYKEFHITSALREPLGRRVIGWFRKPKGTGGSKKAAGKADEKDAPLDAPEQPMQTDERNTRLELGPTGVKASSPVLGVIILLISMGFFYLYLKTVYPIQETITVVSSRPAAATKGEDASK